MRNGSFYAESGPTIILRQKEKAYGLQACITAKDIVIACDKLLMKLEISLEFLGEKYE
jgi:hypothetical protein